MPSFVILPQSFPKSEDPVEINVCTPEGCSLHPSTPVPPKDHAPMWGASVLNVLHFSSQPSSPERKIINLAIVSLSGTWHVPRDTGRHVAGTIVVPAFQRIERCHSRPDPTGRLASRGQNAWTHKQTNKHTSSQTGIANFFSPPSPV